MIRGRSGRCRVASRPTTYSQEALIALLDYDPRKLRTTWEALSVGIARKKAFAALRRATRGRRSSGRTPTIRMR